MHDRAVSASVRVWARANRIPMLKAQPRQRKYEIAERYRPTSPVQLGPFLILEGRAPSPVWEILPGEISATRSLTYTSLTFVSPYRPRLGLSHRPNTESYPGDRT